MSNLLTHHLPFSDLHYHLIVSAITTYSRSLNFAMLARTPTPPPKPFQSQLLTPPPTDRKAKVAYPPLDQPSPTPHFSLAQVSRKPNDDRFSRDTNNSLAIVPRRPLALTSPSAARETLSFTADLDASDGMDEAANSGASDEGVLSRGVYARNGEVRRMAEEITEDVSNPCPLMAEFYPHDC
jgi:hypothetical protein